jgi:hypothetical protein
VRFEPSSVLALLFLGMLSLPAAADCTAVEVARTTGNGFTVPARSVRCTEETPQLDAARSAGVCASLPAEADVETRAACEEAAAHAAHAARKSAVRTALRRGVAAAEVASRYGLPLAEVEAVQAFATAPLEATE